MNMEEQEEEEVSLRGRLAARERENLALVRSLHGLKAQCSQLEGACQALAARVAPEAAPAATETNSDASLAAATASVDEHSSSLRSCDGQDMSTIMAGSSGDDIGLEDVKLDKKEADSAGRAFDSALAGAKHDEDADEQQGAAYWRARAARLEQLLDVAARKNLAFEDTIARLEVQVQTMERHLDTLHHVPTAKGRRSGGSSFKTTSTTASSAILSLSSASIVPAVSYQHQETLVSTAHPSRSEAMQREIERLRADIDKRKQEAARLRSAVQRKGKLVAHEKTKTATLQERLSSITCRAEDLVEAQTQCVELRAKVKEQARQLQDVRLAGSACHEDNVQLSFRLQQTKKELLDASTRIKALQNENQRLRSQLADAASGGNISVNDGDIGSFSRSNAAKRTGRVASGSDEPITGAEEELKALRRRVLQKQELIVKGKAQVAALEEELSRERASALKLEQTNRQLQQNLKSQLATSTRTVSQVQTESQAQLSSKQQQLDGLRASVYDVFEAFVCCFEPTVSVRGSGSPSNSQTAGSSFISNQEDAYSDSSGDERLDKACRWTDFSLDDLATLQVTKSAKRSARPSELTVEDATCAQLEAKVALRTLEKALDRWPEDCRSEICRVLDSMFNQRRQR